MKNNYKKMVSAKLEALNYAGLNLSLAGDATGWSLEINNGSERVISGSTFKEIYFQLELLQSLLSKDLIKINQ